ncbi:MAG: hypothetical protein KC543_10175 [Myxococcales bacterium]|nr:hypothetical protein [Myxococcales bacterium]
MSPPFTCVLAHPDEVVAVWTSSRERYAESRDRPDVPFEVGFSPRELVVLAEAGELGQLAESDFLAICRKKAAQRAYRLSETSYSFQAVQMPLGGPAGLSGAPGRSGGPSRSKATRRRGALDAGWWSGDAFVPGHAMAEGWTLGRLAAACGLLWCGVAPVDHGEPRGAQAAQDASS